MMTGSIKDLTQSVISLSQIRKNQAQRCDLCKITRLKLAAIAKTLQKRALGISKACAEILTQTMSSKTLSKSKCANADIQLNANSVN